MKCPSLKYRNAHIQSDTANARAVCLSIVLHNLTSCLSRGCSWLERTIPTFEPYVRRDLYIRSSNTHHQQTQLPKASKRKVRTHHRRVADDRHRCTAQCTRVNILRDNFFGCGDGRIGLGFTSPLPKMCLTCTLVQVKNRNLFSGRSRYIVPNARGYSTRPVGTAYLDDSPARIAHTRSFVVVRITGGLMLSKSYTGQDSDSLVDGTSEVLERENFDESAAHRRRGVWFRATLKG